MKKNRVFIPSSVLPSGSKRITNAAGERVWLINGQEFESKRAYFQYLKDKSLAEKTNAGSKSDTVAKDLVVEAPIDKSHDATASPTVESTAPKPASLKSMTEA